MARMHLALRSVLHRCSPPPRCRHAVSRRPRPSARPPPEPPRPPLSTVSATLTVPVKTILAVLDEKTKGEIAHLKNAPVDCLVAKCRLDLDATRQGPFRGAARDGTLILALPFAVDAHLSFKSRLFKTGADANAAGEALAQTRLALGPDWQLKPQTVGVVRLERGKLKLGPVSMSLADLWNHNEEQLSRPLFKTLDRHLASAVKVKPQAQRLWIKAFRPDPHRQVAGSLADAFARADPRRPDAHASRCGDRFACRGDSRPRDCGTETANARQGSAAADAVTIDPTVQSLPRGRAGGAELHARGRTRDGPVGKKPIHVGSTKIRFEKLAILPSGEDVVVEARFCVVQGWDWFGWFNSCGTGYLRGAPVFDAAHGILRITKLHYDLATADLILSAMRMLAGDALGSALQTKLVFDVSREIEKLHGQINKALTKPQGRGVEITGHVDRYGPPALTWTRDGFLATFTGEGHIRADLNIPPPKPPAAKKKKI